jgi:hypothetical protein
MMNHPLRHRSSTQRAAALMLTLGSCLGAAAPALAEETPGSSAATAEPGVVQRVEGAVTRGVKAAASGVEVGARAAASGVQRGVKAAAHGVEVGAKATAEVASSVASKVGAGAGSK